MNQFLHSTPVCPSDTDLKASVDGELSPILCLRVRRHLRSCAACAEATRALTLLGTEARRWRAAQAPPPALHPQILSRLEFAPDAAPHREEKLRRALGWTGVTLVTAALTLWLTLAPQGRHGRILAATVRQALADVNTWHLHGWKLVEGKRVPWEVWGCRSPFFYREQLGAQIITDDGMERMQVFPPDPALWRPAGLVVKTPSRPGDDAENKGLDFATRYAIWPDNLKPWRETRDQVVFNENDAGMNGPGTVTDSLYTVDKKTALPVQIEVRRGNRQTPDRLTSEFLTVEYDVPLPGTGAAPALPSSYPVVDATCTAPASRLPRENAATDNGVTVQVTPLGEDADGNVLVQVHAWLGDVLLGTRPPLFVFVDARRTLGDKADSPPAVYDDQGRGYVGVELQDGPPNQVAEDRLIVLSPLEPLPAKARRPRRLTLTLRVAPAITVPVSGLKGMATSQNLLEENIGVLVSLPENIQPFDGSRLHGLSEEPLDAVIATAHADYWINDFDWTAPSDLMRLKGLRSIAWRKQALHLLPPGNRDAPLEHERLLQADDELARWYHHHGDQKRATDALRALIAESDQPLAVPNDFRKRAEEDMRAWTRPGTR